MRKKIAKRVWGLSVCLGSLLASPGWAEDTQIYDQYRVSAAAEGEVANDLMRVVMVVEHQSQDLASLAQKINKQMKEALEQVEAVTAVQSSTRSYRTQPVYDRDRQNQVAWRGSQALHLQSTDIEALGKVISELQSQLRLQSTHYEAQFGTREVVENNLISKALEAFRRRADVVVQSMNAKGYKVVEVDVLTSGHAPFVAYDSAPVAMRSMQAEAVPMMANEAGNSTLRVEASGRIELLFEGSE